jgi:hypothetical protein
MNSPNTIQLSNVDAMKLVDDSLPNFLRQMYSDFAGVIEEEEKIYEVFPGVGKPARSSESCVGTDEPTGDGNGENRQRNIDDQVLCTFGERTENLR